jgi:glycosyltransferase involved in cell wall biosynthesis
VLTIAGSVCGRLGAVPEGVRPLGLVPDLAPLYAAAGVVVSPLHTGSGLKIKLVEAMGHGKAIVATPVTMQGVESLGGTAVLVEEDPARFADAVLSLLADPARRATLAEAALAAACARFSASACYAEAVAFLAGAATPAPAALAMPQAAD